MPLLDLPRVYLPDRAAWRAWLMAHHQQPTGIWLVYDKKVGRAPQRLSYHDIVEEALCFGWIDSRPGKISDTQSMLLLTPRKPKSGWSKLNKTRLEKIEREGGMTPAGQAKIDAAKADGSWESLDAVEALTVPPDLQAALAQNRLAAAAFAQFSATARKGILLWISTAKRPETRAQRLAEVVARAAEGNVANQWRPG
jgi:uncharacterized protein YdeI (YjbR/CyaY-like superfamily)